VAGSFYPPDANELADRIDSLLGAARPGDAATTAARAGLAGILVPHAGLVFSGPVAATAWRLAGSVFSGQDTTIVLLGTNHGAWWLDGVGIWDAGAWRTPLGDVEVDAELASGISALGPPFAVDREAHEAEHSIEVQLPFVSRAMPLARIVPLAVGAGTGRDAVGAGERLGDLLATRRAEGARICLAISTDMAHYPPAAVGARITEELAPAILALDPARLARAETDITQSGLPGVACGMCGIQPSVLGLAALRAMGVELGVRLVAATSADAGGSPGRTVGYLAAAFPG
jgi:AmmeMemoRadiSam system protein B